LVSLHELSGLTSHPGYAGVAGNASLLQCEVEWLRPRVSKM
jgi:hypothetical protein